MKLATGILAVCFVLGATGAGDLAKTIICSENYSDDLDSSDNFEECMREGGFSSLDIACARSRRNAGDQSGMYECLGFDFQKYIQYQVSADLDAAICVQKELLGDFSSLASLTLGGEGYQNTMAAAVNKCYAAPQFSEAKRECFQKAYQMEDLTQVEYLLATCAYNMQQPYANGPEVESYGSYVFDESNILDITAEDSYPFVEGVNSYEHNNGEGLNMNNQFDIPVEEVVTEDFENSVDRIIGTDLNENDPGNSDFGWHLHEKKNWE